MSRVRSKSALAEDADVDGLVTGVEATTSVFDVGSGSGCV